MNRPTADTGQCGVGRDRNPLGLIHGLVDFSL